MYPGNIDYAVANVPCLDCGTPAYYAALDTGSAAIATTIGEAYYS